MGWGSIKKGSFGNEIRYADIHSGSFGVQIDSTDVAQRALTMENSLITTTTNHAISVRQANVFIGNSQITNAGGDCLHVRGGDVTLVHCTLGRFFVFTGGYGHALDFANYDNDVRLPLKKLQMYNCIVTGYQEDELMGSNNTDFEDDAFNYNFANSLINTPKPKDDDAHFVNCLWDVKIRAIMHFLSKNKFCVTRILLPSLTQTICFLALNFQKNHKPSERLTPQLHSSIIPTIV